MKPPIGVNLRLKPRINLALVESIPLNPLKKGSRGDFEKIPVPPLLRGVRGI